MMMKKRRVEIRFPDVFKLHDLKTRNIELDHVKKCDLKIREIETKIKKINEQLSDTETLSRQKRTSLYAECNHNVRKLNLELGQAKREKADTTSVLTSYLLEAHPILNELHVNRRNLEKKEESQHKRLFAEKIEIVNRYLRKFYPERDQINKSGHDLGNSNVSRCCNLSLRQTNEGHLLCPGCGLVVEECATSLSNPHKNVSYNRSITKSKIYSYKKLNHFREFLREIQGESKGQVPPKVMQILNSEIKKNRLLPAEISPKIIRKFLKRNSLQRYYEHSLSIAASLNKEVKPVKLSPLYQERLCLYFVNLEDPFERIKSLVDKSRRNFLSYSYTFCRLNQLLGKSEYNKHIQILKSVRLVQVQDRYWKLLCKELQWPYLGRMHSA